METFFWSVFSARVTAKNTLGIFLFNQHESTGGTFFIPGNQEGLFKLAIQLRFFFLFGYLQHCNWICFVGLFDRYLMYYLFTLIVTTTKNIVGAV
jgi:hypothetical protein